MRATCEDSERLERGRLGSRPKRLDAVTFQVFFLFHLPVPTRGCPQCGGDRPVRVAKPHPVSLAREKETLRTKGHGESRFCALLLLDRSRSWSSTVRAAHPPKPPQKTPPPGQRNRETPPWSRKIVSDPSFYPSSLPAGSLDSLRSPDSTWPFLRTWGPSADHLPTLNEGLGPPQLSWRGLGNILETGLAPVRPGRCCTSLGLAVQP